MYHKRSVIAYKSVVNNKLLKYQNTGYAMQLLWKSAPIKPLLDIHCLLTLTLHMWWNIPVCTRFEICLLGKMNLGVGYPIKLQVMGYEI